LIRGPLPRARNGSGRSLSEPALLNLYQIALLQFVDVLLDLCDKASVNSCGSHEARRETERTGADKGKGDSHF